MSKERYLLLSASTFQIKNNDSGKIENEGCIMYFIPASELKTYAQRDYKGLRPMKQTMPIEWFSKVTVAPAFYDVELGVGVNSKLQQVLQVQEMQFACMAQFEQLEPGEVSTGKQSK